MVGEAGNQDVVIQIQTQGCPVGFRGVYFSIYLKILGQGTQKDVQCIIAKTKSALV